MKKKHLHRWDLFSLNISWRQIVFKFFDAMRQQQRRMRTMVLHFCELGHPILFGCIFNVLKQLLIALKFARIEGVRQPLPGANGVPGEKKQTRGEPEGGTLSFTAGPRAATGERHALHALSLPRSSVDPAPIRLLHTFNLESFMSRLKSSRSSFLAIPILQMAFRLGGGAAVLAVLGLAGVAVAQPAATSASTEAAQKKVVTVVLTQAKIIKDAQGKEQLVAADSVKPGDVLEYTATYTNHTGKAVTGLMANLPIPEGLEYLPKTAKPGATLVKVATKDGAFAAEPLARVVNGKSEPVPYNEYRSLRWTLGQLPANGVTAVTARAKVETVTPPAAAPAAAAVPAPAADKVARKTP